MTIIEQSEENIFLLLLKNVYRYVNIYLPPRPNRTRRLPIWPRSEQAT